MNNQTSILSDEDLDIVVGGGLDGWTHRLTAATGSSGPGLHGPNADFTKSTTTKGVSGMDLGSGR